MSVASTINNFEMDLQPSKYNVCIICCKHRAVHDGAVISKLFKLMERFIGENILTFPSGSSKNNIISYLGCCENCVLLTNSFCEIYHQMNCLKLRLEWSLSKLLTVMRMASSLSNLIERPDLENFTAFRDDLTEKCARKLTKSQPRVTLKRIDEPDVNFKQFSEIKCEVDNNSTFHCPASPPTHDQILIDWFLSLAAVAMLVLPPTEIKCYPMIEKFGEKVQMSIVKNEPTLLISEGNMVSNDNYVESNEMDEHSENENWKEDNEQWTTPIAYQLKEGHSCPSTLQHLHVRRRNMPSPLNKESMRENLTCRTNEGHSADQNESSCVARLNNNFGGRLSPIPIPKKRKITSVNYTTTFISSLPKTYKCDQCFMNFIEGNAPSQHKIQMHCDGLLLRLCTNINECQV